jgi:choline-sulfatase
MASRARWLWLLAALLVPLSAIALHQSQQKPPIAAAHRAPSRPSPPNILILIGDDHAGGTLGIEGDPRRATPRLDQLARQSVRFERAYCNAPLCTPSRQSLITGRLPHAVGVTQLATPLPEDAITLGRWLVDRGYATGAFGKMHFNDTLPHGFRERLDTRDWLKYLEAHPPPGGHVERPWRPFQDPAAVWLNAACEPVDLPADSMEATYYASQAADFFRRHRAEPFLLVVGFYEPHAPFRFPREWKGRYRPDSFPVSPISRFDKADRPLIFNSLTAEDVRGIKAAYYTSLSFLDHSVGLVLDALDAFGLAENTIVVYLSDNGYLLGQHGRFEKHVLYEPAVHVPCAIRWPKRILAGGVVPDLVELVDLFPTLMELSGQPSPPDLHGRSLVPLLDGRAGAVGRETVLSEYLENEEAMIRSRRFKLIVGTGRRHRQDGYANADPLPGPYEQLYDLDADPEEATNLAGKPELATVQTDLRHRLYERLVTTRAGSEPVPQGLLEQAAIEWCLVPRDKMVRPEP